MQAGQVIGRVVASHKYETLEGAKLLLIQPLTWEKKPSGDPLVAADTVGAGAGELVFWVAAREAAMALGGTSLSDMPCSDYPGGTLRTGEQKVNQHGVPDRLRSIPSKRRVFIDLCGVDHLGRDPRFDVVVNLLSVEHRERVLIKVGVESDDPAIPTISEIYAGANFYERETWDLFGIVFEGHPDLTRLLMPDEWEGHPLRKDFRVGSVPVEFKATR